MVGHILALYPPEDSAGGRKSSCGVPLSVEIRGTQIKSSSLSEVMPMQFWGLFVDTSASVDLRKTQTLLPFRSPGCDLVRGDSLKHDWYAKIACCHVMTCFVSSWL